MQQTYQGAAAFQPARIVVDAAIAPNVRQPTQCCHPPRLSAVWFSVLAAQWWQQDEVAAVV